MKRKGSKKLKTKAATTTEEITPLTARTSQLVGSLRVPFLAFAEGFAHLSTARSEIAPQFMKTFKAWQLETHGTLAAFVRLYDDSVPLDRDGYRSHPTYQSADYLRRLHGRGAREPLPFAKRPITPLVALARLVATVMPAVDPTGTIWSVFVREMRWSDQQAERLKVLSVREGAITLPPRTKHNLTTLRAAA